MPKYYIHSFSVGEDKIPVRVYPELRSSIRYSIGKNYLILRIPKVIGEVALSKHLKDLEKWAWKKEKEKPGTLTRLLPKKYCDGDTLQILDISYTLHLSVHNRNKFSGSLSDKKVFIKIPQEASEAQKHKGIRDVIIKLLNRAYQPYIKGKVLDWNKKWFHEKIENVTLKYNTSNWGSCSSKRNINLSTRLLLTNQKVLDYVIVHELSHLKEMNHSRKFWKIVENVMPEYEVYEDWLSENGRHCHL